MLSIDVGFNSLTNFLIPADSNWNIPSTSPLENKSKVSLSSSGISLNLRPPESAGMRKFVSELKPTSIDDLIAAIALYRPGPMENIPLYVARRHGKEKVTYIHEDLKDILESTYGIIIYQEQIMQIAGKIFYTHLLRF